MVVVVVGACVGLLAPQCGDEFHLTPQLLHGPLLMKTRLSFFFLQFIMHMHKINVSDRGVTSRGETRLKSGFNVFRQVAIAIDILLTMIPSALFYTGIRLALASLIRLSTCKLRGRTRGITDGKQ